MEEPRPASLIFPRDFPYRAMVRTLAPDDQMFAGDHAHYVAVGVSALAGIARGLACRAAPRPVEAILDLPCGHGRVTRILRAHFPEARITVCDLDPAGVEFCAAAFAARGVYSTPELDALALGERYDLIWVGSLLTHLDAADSESLVRCCLAHLAPGGVAIVSAHGAFVAGRMFEAILAEREIYGLAPGVARDALDRYCAEGYGFAAYPWAEGAAHPYGISLSSQAWLRALVGRLGGAVLDHAPHAWDRHHDLLTLSREPAG